MDGFHLTSVAMLVHRTIEKKVFWEIDSIIMQNMNHNYAIVLCTNMAVSSRGRKPSIDLIHDSRHVGFAIITQISYTLLRGKTTQVREVITNILATQMICFMFIECLSPK